MDVFPMRSLNTGDNIKHEVVKIRMRLMLLFGLGLNVYFKCPLEIYNSAAKPLVYTSV